MSSMSYCAFENTAGDLQQLLNIVSDYNTLEDLLESCSSEYERGGVRNVINICRELVDEFDRIE